MRLLDLPDALKDGLLTGVITEGHARALQQIKDSSAMIGAYKTILKENGSVRRAEEIARRTKAQLDRLDKPEEEINAGAIKPTLGEDMDAVAVQLQELLGENARVSIRRSRKETAVHIVFRGNPKYTEEQIQYVYRALTGAYGMPVSNGNR
jgi:ParB family chromosome partitioning protein